MIKNYIRVALRSIFRNKLHSFINIAGLGIGIAVSLLILVYVVDQLSYESMHENRANIVRVSVILGSGGSSMTLAGAMSALAPAASSELPEVKAAVRFRADRKAEITLGNRKFTERNFFFADSNVLNVFTFPLIAGNKATALNNPSSIVISEATARKYFGNDDPIGKSLTYNNKYNFAVSAVMKDVPWNTMLRPELIAPYSRATEIQNTVPSWTKFGSDYTYLYLRDRTSRDKLPVELEQLLVRNTNRAMASLLSFKVIPLSDIYFTSGMTGELGPTGNISYVYMFSLAAVLVLVIACLNFISLSTARSLCRSKEVGLRKLLGAKRVNLLWQFFGESLVATLLSLLVAVFIFEMVNPLLYGYFDMEELARSYLNTNFFAVLFGILLFVAMAAGIYPAVFLSRFAPVDSLRGTRMPGSPASILRKVLVVTQFAIAVFLLSGTAVIFKQLNFMRNSDLGFNKNGVVVVNFPELQKKVQEKYPVIKQTFQSIPGVLDVSGAYTLPGINNYETQSVSLKGSTESEYSMIQAVAVDYDYIRTLGLKLLQGRNFSRRFAADSGEAIILNESAVRYLDLQNPIGVEVNIPSEVQGKTRTVKVIGVIKDFHIASFQKEIGPLFLYINPKNFYTIGLRIDQAQSPGIVSALNSAWGEILPEAGFDYSYLAQTYDNLYKSDERTGHLFSIFAFLAILIGCMGLFGLASHLVELRTKEIGVRKVLGASIPGIVILLSKEFARWVLIANVVAWPLAYYVMNNWLKNFAYRTDMSVWIFIASGALALIIALLTVSSHAIKAATANPVESLRYE
jgi:putative ABC transport system permease protein